MNNTQEFNSIKDVIEGCDEIVITYALNDEMKLCKIVTLYNSREFGEDYIQCGIGETMKAQKDISLFRSIRYYIKDKIIKCSSRLNFAVLLKTVPGFVPGENVHDCRTFK